jgi:hypothetical protein
MSVSRRMFIKATSILTVGIAALFKAKAVKSSTHREVLGYQLHDDVSVTLLERYARSLALEDKAARWQAQMMFHKAQLAREGGGTMSHKLGYRHRAFVRKFEGRALTESDLFILKLNP